MLTSTCAATLPADGLAADGVGVAAVAAGRVAALGLGVAAEGDRVALGAGRGRVGVAQAGLRVAGARVAAVAAGGVRVAAGRAVAALVDRGVVVLDDAGVAAAAVDAGAVDGAWVASCWPTALPPVAVRRRRRRRSRCRSDAELSPPKLMTWPSGEETLCAALGAAWVLEVVAPPPLPPLPDAPPPVPSLDGLRDAGAVGLTGSVLRGRGRGRRPCGGEDQCSCCDVPLLAHNSLAAPSRCPPARSLLRRVLEGPRQDLFANGGEIRQTVSIVLLAQHDWWVMKQRFLPGRYSRYPRYPALGAI